MAKRTPGTAGYTAADIEELERLSLEKANRAISAIENALAVWDATPDKPEQLKHRVNRLKSVHAVLSGWERKMLRARGIDARAAILKEFVGICSTYA
jgi:hypothetical protein